MMISVEQIKDPESEFNAEPPATRLTLMGGIDLTARAIAGDLKPAYGYEEYVRQVIDNLGHRRSTLLLGPSGVGKTAVLHDVVRRLIDIKVSIPYKIITQFSTSTIMLGCRYWGEWEAKLGAIVEALQACGSAALYVDNIWNLRQAATSQYSSESLWSFLQPYIERKDIVIIGESTQENFSGTRQAAGNTAALADDPALLRLFSVLTVEEPHPPAALSIVEAVAHERAERFALQIPHASVARCLDLTQRFQRAAALPGAAITLLDAVIEPYRPAEPPPASAPVFQAPTRNGSDTMRNLSRVIADSIADVDATLAAHHARANGPHAASYLPTWLDARAECHDEDPVISVPAQVAVPRPLPVLVTPEMVTTTFARQTRLPEFMFSDAVPLPSTEVHAYFAARVIGQEAAIDAMVEQILLIKAELTDPSRPLGVVLLCGPTGTGKTLLAKTLAQYLFGSDEALVRLDMSEYQNPISAFMLPTHLQQRLGRRPFAVILLDEIEKAAVEVFDLWLQGLGDGHLSGKDGERISLHNTVIVLTSNLGSDTRVFSTQPMGYLVNTAGDGASAGIDALERSVESAVQNHFRPEFVNRIDRIIVFQPLDRSTVRAIVRRELRAVLQRVGLTRRRLHVEVDETVVELLIDVGFDVRYGARPLQRAIRDQLTTVLATWIALHPQHEKDRLTLIAQGNRIAVSLQTHYTDSLAQRV